MKKVKDYINLPYNYIIQPISDESGLYYYAKVLELDGCQSTGETFEEAYNNVREAMEGWIDAKLSGGLRFHFLLDMKALVENLLLEFQSHYIIN